MSEPWTQGPWVAAEYDDSTIGVGPSGRTEPLAFLGIEDWEEARLIALAPEMAELLALIVAAKQGWSYEADHLLERARGEGFR